MHVHSCPLLVDLLRYIQSAIFLSAAYLAASAHVELETLVPLLDWQMFPEISSSSEVDTLVAVLVGSQLGGVYGTIEALFLPNTSGVVAGVAAGVVDVDIVVDFAASALPAAAAAVVVAAAAAGVAAAAGAAAAASAAAAGSAAAAAAAAAAVGDAAADAAMAAAAAAVAAAGAAAEGVAAFVDVELMGSVGLASYPMGASMPLARRYLPLISTENPLGTWMMACVAARIHRYCHPQIELILRLPHRLVEPAY